MKSSQQHGYVASITLEPQKKRGKYNKPTPKQISDARELLASGITLRDASGIVGVPTSTLHRYLNKPVKAAKRTKKQMRKDNATIKALIAQGARNPEIAKETGLTLGQVENQIHRHNLRQKAKPRIVYAKPTLWQKIKKLVGL